MSIVENALVWLGQDSAGIVGELVSERRIALLVGMSEVGRQRFERLVIGERGDW